MKCNRFRFNILSGVVLAAAAMAGTAVADPLVTPFLSIDLDGDSGDTHAGFAGWELTDAVFVTIPESNSFNTAGVTSGSIDIDITGQGVGMATLDRENPPDSEPFNEMYHDAVYTTRDTAGAFGRHYLQFDFAGFDANQKYELTMFAYDQNNGNEGDDQGFMAWGTEDPAAWLDANVADGASYQPGIGGVNNPIPTLRRAPMTGGWPSNFGGNPGGAYQYSASFVIEADANGEATVYGWADPNSYSTQDVSMANGIAIGVVPEPASMALLGLAAVGLLIAPRRRG